jgi:hypothetical protein
MDGRANICSLKEPDRLKASLRAVKAGDGIGIESAAQVLVIFSDAIAAKFCGPSLNGLIDGIRREDSLGLWKDVVEVEDEAGETQKVLWWIEDYREIQGYLPCSCVWLLTIQLESERTDV